MVNEIQHTVRRRSPYLNWNGSWRPWTSGISSYLILERFGLEDFLFAPIDLRRSKVADPSPGQTFNSLTTPLPHSCAGYVGDWPAFWIDWERSSHVYGGRFSCAGAKL